MNTEPRIAERRLASEPLPDWREHIRRSWEDLDYRAPGGETGREVQLRVRQVLDETATTEHRRVLLVSHGNLLGLLMKTIDASFDHVRWEALTNPDVFRVRPGHPSRALERLWPGE